MLLGLNVVESIYWLNLYKAWLCQVYAVIIQFVFYVNI